VHNDDRDRPELFNPKALASKKGERTSLYEPEHPSSLSRGRSDDRTRESRSQRHRSRSPRSDRGSRDHRRYRSRSRNSEAGKANSSDKQHSDSSRRQNTTAVLIKCENCDSPNHMEAECTNVCGACGHDTHKSTMCGKKNMPMGMCNCHKSSTHVPQDCNQTCKHCLKYGISHGAQDCRVRCAVCGKLGDHAGYECYNRGRDQPCPCGKYHLGQEHIHQGVACKRRDCGRYFCLEHPYLASSDLKGLAKKDHLEMSNKKSGHTGAIARASPQSKR